MCGGTSRERTAAGRQSSDGGFRRNQRNRLSASQVEAIVPHPRTCPPRSCCLNKFISSASSSPLCPRLVLARSLHRWHQPAIDIGSHGPARQRGIVLAANPENLID